MSKQIMQLMNMFFFYSRLLFCRITHSNWRKDDSSVHQPFHRLNSHSYVAGASHLFDGPEVNNVLCSRIFHDNAQKCNQMLFKHTKMSSQLHPVLNYLNQVKKTNFVQKNAHELSMTGYSLAGSIARGSLIQVEKAGHRRRKGRLRLII